MSSAIALLLSVLVLSYVLTPILSARRAEDAEQHSQPQIQSLEDKLQRLGQLLQDLELDHQMGKVAQAEFDRMRSTIEADFSVTQLEIDRLGAKQ